ncbi:hypothetical protein GCK32_017567 [Trichostrongylus colubriformis]|uniref:DUF1758 domain-containing protein n=1 Tax=Trichostrongylus colubriformis TaxID=6319 RepID=A0AAN8I8C7_TRICO
MKTSSGEYGSRPKVMEMPITVTSLTAKKKTTARDSKEHFDGNSSRKPELRSRQKVVTSSVQLGESKCVQTELDTTVLQMNDSNSEVKSHDNGNSVVLPAASARVRNQDDQLVTATILLDTGSKLSFIEEAFAEQLGLRVVDNVTLHIGTFGSAVPKKKTCSVSTLQLCDAEGRYHDLRVYRNHFITTTIKQEDLDQRDLAFIKAHDLQLSLSVMQSPLQPKILLGCDYVWTFIEDTKHHQLSSGLKLIPRG